MLQLAPTTLAPAPANDIKIRRRDIPAAHESAKQLKTLGRCFVRGVKQLECVTPLFEAGNRKCLILTDSDSTAREHQKKFHQNRGYGVWKRYDEILGTSTAITGEDFIKEAAFEAQIQEAAKRYKIPLLSTDDLNGAGGRIGILRRWLTDAGIPKQDVDNAIESIKDGVFDSLKNSDVKADYFEYLSNIVPIVDAM